MARKKPQGSLAGAASASDENRQPEGDGASGRTEQRILEEYLGELKAIRSTGAGVPETSYYPALSNLFNAVGKTLKPKVRCVMGLKNLGAGMPDGGLVHRRSISASSRWRAQGRPTAVAGRDRSQGDKA